MYLFLPFSQKETIFIILLKICEKYGSVFCHCLTDNSRVQCFINIHLPGPRDYIQAVNRSVMHGGIISVAMELGYWNLGSRF